VRDGARELTVSLYKRVGSGFDWEPHLRLLRAKQREEYERAFEDVGDDIQPAAAPGFQTEVYGHEDQISTFMPENLHINVAF
jgi:hypothetical protein